MEHQKEYGHYNIEDFITDDYFLQWVRFPDAATDAFWQRWIAAHPHKRQQVEAARAFIQGLRFKEQRPAAADVDAALERNLAMIAALEKEQDAPVIRRRSLRVWRWAAAAAVTGLVALAGFQFLQKQQPRLVVYSGFADGVRNVRLPDSSEVILNARASISFHPDWQHGAKREVWLKGEAFFDIKQAPAHPFTVHSANSDIDVLGTSFNVKEGAAYTNVTLNTGKIKVRFGDLPEKQFYLAPGDFVQYSARNNKITKKRVNADLYAVWKEEGRQLKNVTLKEIAVYIEDIYGYHVQISNGRLAAAELSGGLRVKDEKLLLETLAFALDLRIDKKADTLFIQPKRK
ncbi:FecR domain-containing protein [uncultured Chitinophaga sp.]|jgi:Fe2+-dicitrate sensor, membrane component|uniref:FecR family protein n=1 Tax=uncultured Chitinophaga sp. TaxID=339340 RepID=UPI00261A5074|nr:FecR domain-containing protein [uncultured Chitinophaga sp.]